MSKGNVFENELMLHVFNNSDIALIGDATGLRGSSTAGSLHVALHSTWPGEAGDQETGEVAYTSYARVAVARSGAGWTVSNNSVVPAAAIEFPACTGSTATANFWTIGTASSGAGKILYANVIGAAPTVLTGATSDTITSPAHGLVVDDPVVFWATYGLALPTGITEGTIYYVKTAPSVDTITISATVGGATLDLTASGVGAVQKVTPIAISTGVTPSLTTSSTVYED